MYFYYRTTSRFEFIGVYYLFSWGYMSNKRRVPKNRSYKDPEPETAVRTVTRPVESTVLSSGHESRTHPLLTVNEDPPSIRGRVERDHGTGETQYRR